MGQQTMLGRGDDGQQLSDGGLLRGLERAAAYFYCWAWK
jgi:hypothetical protein